MYIKQKEIKWDKQLTFQELRLHFLTLQRMREVECGVNLASWFFEKGIF